MEQKENIHCPHCGNRINIGALLGSRTSEKKAASSAENGKKGGRPKKLVSMTGFSCNAMKDNKLHVLKLIPMHVIGSGAKAEYKLIVCYPGGAQADAEYQPLNDGNFPNIELLAEKNGFEPLDIRQWAK